ncbi:uncharacterized protein BDZ99DRAFT_456770 [Mytilinidion resinicola]|uniref:Uncharacterized protein n=1 Tax=Mytilinidion resinicola TaxID=574789 RepID=A0A6A6Z7F8_9PEZI|nr:uncharacterized protein BDZ99DRAFT_456770 [Mytilinidion resinicola]KAF2816970.1 hypothetical protein BDZ99DRAFT_456770 [Mytilinidion resinicola]
MEFGRYDHRRSATEAQVVMRMRMLADLKERLTIFVDGSNNMEPHCKRYASVNVWDLLWKGRGDAELERCDDVLEQWLECLRIMRSDSHTHWKVITPASTTAVSSIRSYWQPHAFDVIWSHLGGWNAIDAAYNDWGFTVVRV